MPEVLVELTPEQFAMWKRHPVTALVFERYLPEYAGRVQDLLLSKFFANQMGLGDEPDARGRVLLARELAEQLSLATLRNFYGVA